MPLALVIRLKWDTYARLLPYGNACACAPHLVQNKMNLIVRQ